MSELPIESATKVVRTDVADTAELPIARAFLTATLYGMTDPGLVRPTNEDQFLVASLSKSLQVLGTSLPQPRERHSSDHTYLMMVADGMGGAAGGEEASAMAVDSVETYVLEALKWFSRCRENEEDQVLSEFQRALGQAHSQVRAQAAENPDLRGMGTTLTLAYSVNDELYLAHVGDSRAYLFRDDCLYRLTQDHSLVEEMVRRGAIAPEEAARHRWRHVITSTVGGDSATIRVDVHRLHLQPGDAVLLCSDGLTEMLLADQITEVLANSSDPRAACEQLVAMANAAGGRDNITVALARYSTLTPPRGKDE
jgi:PPM family protein phosphatase